MQVDVLDLLAEVRLLTDQADEAILDLQENLGPFLNRLLEGTGGFDGEGLTTVPEGLAESPLFDKRYRGQKKHRSIDEIEERRTQQEGWEKGQPSLSAGCSGTGLRSTPKGCPH